MPTRSYVRSGLLTVLLNLSVCVGSFVAPEAAPYPLGNNSTAEPGCTYAPALRLPSRASLDAARRSQLLEPASVSVEAVSRIPLADQATCTGLDSQDRALLAANMPWIASGGSLPPCVTVPRSIVHDVSNPGLALATRKKLENTCIIMLGDSTMSETLIDLVGFLGGRMPWWSQAQQTQPQSDSNFLFSPGGKDPGGRRNSTATFKDHGIVIHYRFTGHYDTTENHLGFQTLQHAALRTEIESTVLSDCGDRKRVLWLESGPHDYSNSMHCHESEWIQWPAPKKKAKPEHAVHSCKESSNPFVMNKTTLRPIDIDPNFAASFRDSISWAETLAPTRMWLSRHFQAIKRDAIQYVSNLGNVMDDFARSETESRPGWTYVDHHQAWACEYEPEARVQTHFEHDKDRGYRCAFRTWLAVRALVGSLED